MLLIRLVSETSLFPLDTIVCDEDVFDIKKSGYHLPALYFLSGLAQIPLHLFKSSISVSLHLTTEKIKQSVINDADSKVSGFPCDHIVNEVFIGSGSGAKCTRNFLQLLFESQSRDLTTKVFAEETLVSLADDPLSCYVTAWCIANSDPTSQWSLWFRKDNRCGIDEFVNHLQKFGDGSYQHGSIIGLFVYKTSVNHLNPSTIAQLPLFSHLQMIVFIFDEDKLNDISISDIDIQASHLLPFLSHLHKLTSLKTLVIIEEDLRLPVASLLPQHCPSLSTVVVSNPGLFRPFVISNFSTLTSILCPLTSTDLNSLCNGLQETTSLKMLQLGADLNTYEEVKVLGCALKQNQSLKQVSISLPLISLDSVELLEQILSCHQTVEQYKITRRDPTHDDNDDDNDDDMKFALAMSQSMAALVYKEGETHAPPQMNHTSGDDDLELAMALAMSLFLEMAEEVCRKRNEEKERRS